MVQEGNTSDLTSAQIVEAMLGPAKNLLVTEGGPAKASASATSRPLLRVCDLNVPGVLDEVSFDVRPGEIFGVAGLVGAGRTTVLRALSGLIPGASATLQIDGQDAILPRGVSKSLKMGFGLIPEDRKGQGLAPKMTAADNIVLPALKRVRRWGLLSTAQTARTASEHGAAVGFAPHRLNAAAEELSGGNQQKLLLARWGFVGPRILLADEPTRGIDIGAKAEILTSLRRSAAHGRAVILVSSEFEEIVSFCDRAIVLKGGRVSGRFDAAEQPLTVEGLLAAAFGIATTMKADE